ncbi:hypothetical protein [Harryflintia acetispora]|uniref:Uncharacterized protein n=1 Tax=Harryflintia acetispora TaxID=1849041 RepID=A0A9X8Y8V6_9FIRM|nr:hypothetical protein [Harryflintia acetispora]TCL44096.1 hypothetical protein EDD78_103134 [Harryflintia acetispora]
MSSINKTELGFNQWSLSDKPTMEDFNADNLLADQILEEKLDKSIISSGEWTPFLYGSTTEGNPTYTARDGFYCKIGPLVVCKGSIVISSKGGMSGALKIGGLPFAAIRSFSQPSAVIRDTNLAAGHIITGTIANYTSLAIIQSSNTTGGSLQASEINDNFYFTNFSAMYITNS